MASDVARPDVVCPSREELTAFLRGQLPQEQMESLVEHLHSCSACAASFQELDAADTVVRRLRDNPSQQTVVDAAACARLEELARAIPQQQSAAPTVSNHTAAPVRERLPLPAVFGAYVLLEQLGQGGMGVVYKARQEALKRLVAVKMVRAGVYAGMEDRARFQREGEVIARIHDPHVVQIHEFGEHNGQLYFAMELLEGGTLANRLKGQPLPQREAAQLVRTLALTVQKAHEQDIVHRDLKPGNVMYTADGTVKITDFGLAKVLDAEGSETVSDAIIGTPAYMAPEQARGESRHIGPAADVYALGVILYEALTGHPPFRAESRYQTLELVRTQEPAAPSSQCRGLSRDLEAICLKCLEKTPSRRYESAQALADDLQRWLDGKPTLVRPSRWPHRLCRFAHRHLLGIGAACLLVLATMLGLALLYFRDPQRQVEALEARLRRGQSVTLIGESGPPVWSQWSPRRQGGVFRSPKGDDTFVIGSLEPAVLTLLRDPQGSYRFRAEVRHEDNTRLGAVGICFGLTTHDTPGGRQYCYASLTFNDFEAKVPDPKTGLRMAHVHWYLRRSTETLGDCSTSLRSHLFSPAGNANTWRQLEAEVAPDAIRVYWENKLIGSVTHPEMHTAAADLTNNEVRGGDKPFALPLPVAFSPRGSLGLYVSRGKAAFRHVVVEPLP